jgi:hypothetical protein
LSADSDYSQAYRPHLAPRCATAQEIAEADDARPLFAVVEFGMSVGIAPNGLTWFAN